MLYLNICPQTKDLTLRSNYFTIDKILNKTQKRGSIRLAAYIKAFTAKNWVSISKYN